jgi:excisionase family DNA binding protein
MPEDRDCYAVDEATELQCTNHLPPLLSIPEVCAYLGLGQTVVREMIRKGEIPHIRIRSRIRVSADDLQRYVERNRAGKEVG